MKSPTLRLQSRDVRLVIETALHRFMRRNDYIARGHFNSIPRCNQRLSQLVQTKWLRRISIVNGLLTQQGLYAPGPTAAHLLRTQLDLPVEEVRRLCSHHEGPLLVEHSLRVLDFRLILEREASRAQVPVQWLCEPECLHAFEFKSGSKWSKVVVKPDGYFRLKVDGNEQHFFLEIDLGHVALPRFKQKLRVYERYLRSGAFTDVYEARELTVLTVTSGTRRLDHLLQLQTSGTHHLITTWKLLKERSAFKRCWVNENGRFSGLGNEVIAE